MFNLIRKHKLVFLILIEFLLIYLLYILKVTPGASGFEASIYAPYPDTFWVIYFLIYLFSLSVVVYSIFIKRDKPFFYTGLFNLVILNFIIFLLPFFRDYFTIDLGDTTAHLGITKDILSTHHLGISNPYPIAHILSASLVLLTQVELDIIGHTIPLFYYLIYILFTWLLVKKLYKNNDNSMLFLLFILIPLLCSSRFFPAQMFFYFVPMLLYVFLRDSDDKSTPFRYILVIMAFLFPLLHPVSVVILFVLLVIISLVYYFARTRGFILRNHGYLLVLYLVIWLFWTAIQSDILQQGILAYRDWIRILFEEYGAQFSYFIQSSRALAQAELSLVDTITLWIKVFGPSYILYGMAFVFSVHYIYRWIKEGNAELHTILSLICLVFIVLQGISFFITVPFFGNRIYPYVLLISILVNAHYLFNLVNALKTKMTRITSLILIIIMLFSLTYIATFGVYPSRFTRRGPMHATYMYLNSVEWHLQTRNKGVPIGEVEAGNGYHRVAIYVLGRDKARDPSLLTEHHLVPPHFNYPEESLLAKTVKKNMYLIINKRTELVSTNVLPEYEDKWAFHPDDYAKLENDRSIDKVYHNDEMKIFIVNGEKWREAN